MGDKSMTIFHELQFPDDFDRRLDTLARETGRSKASHILEAIAEYLEDQEAIHEAAIVLERAREGKEKIYTAEEVRNILALEN